MRSLDLSFGPGGSTKGSSRMFRCGLKAPGHESFRNDRTCAAWTVGKSWWGHGCASRSLPQPSTEKIFPGCAFLAHKFFSPTGTPLRCVRADAARAFPTRSDSDRPRQARP